jgi:hypothetical protein
MKSVRQRTPAEGRGKGIDFASAISLSNMVNEFRQLNTPEAKAAFLSSWLAIWAADIERTWPFLCQVLQWVESEKLYADTRVFPHQTFPDFKSFFEARLKKPFALWYELEQTHRFVTNYAPDLIDKTFGEAKAEAARRAHEVAVASQATQGPVGVHHNDMGDKTSASQSSGKTIISAERRLRKDRKDLWDRVLAGELTWHGAMIEARFWKRKPSRKISLLDRIRKLIAKMTPEERQKLIEELIASNPSSPSLGPH